MLFLLVFATETGPFMRNITERMIKMAKVYEFPTKKVQKLPEEIEKRLYQVAKDYVEVLQDALPSLDNDVLAEPEYSELVDLVSITYAEGIIKAVSELE